MPCQGCSQSSPLSFTSFFKNSPCPSANCGENCSTSDASCVVYTGSPLPCSGVQENDNLEVALSKIDEKICQTAGDYSGYNFNCLLTWWGTPITNESTFVDAITGYACQITTALNNFIGITFTTYVATTEDRLDNLENPDITCDSAGVNPVDGLGLILTKYCTKFATIDSQLDISDVIFDNCLTVVDFPSTIPEAFQLLADQICLIHSGSQTLPTFDNIGSCLNDPSSDDSLVDTIIKIRDRLCIAPTWDASPINWYCVTEPSDPFDLGEAMQNILSQILTLSNGLVTFDGGDFTIEATDPLNSCAGVTVHLATPLNQDRFVAANSSDSSPSTLIAKLVGVGITVDDTTNPGQITLTSTATTDDHKVLADISDDTPNYLVNKLNGDTLYGVSITPSYNSTSKQVDLLLGVNPDILFDILLDSLTPGSDLYTKFCEKVAGCPSPCDAPTNVQAIPGVVPTTSTTTLP